MKQNEDQMKNRHGSSFIHSVFKEVQLIHFQWSFSDARFSHKQASYFTANRWYFKTFTLPSFLGTKFLTHKKSMAKILSSGTSGMTALVVIRYLIYESNSCCFSTKSILPPIPKTYLNKLSILFYPQNTSKKKRDRTVSVNQ